VQNQQKFTRTKAPTLVRVKNDAVGFGINNQINGGIYGKNYPLNINK